MAKTTKIASKMFRSVSNSNIILNSFQNEINIFPNINMNKKNIFFYT